MEQGGPTATAPTAFPSAKRKRVAEDCQDLRKDVGLDSDLPVAPSTSTSSATSTSSTSFSSSSSSSPFGSFESVVQDEARYRAHRHAPLPAAVARTLEDKAGWGRDVSAQRQRCAEDAVQRKQAELDRTNHLYKALARKSFQLSVTLLLHPAPTEQQREEEEVGIPTNSQQQQLPAPSPATTPASSSPSPTSGGVGMPPVDIHRTIVLPAAMPLAKLHKTLQTMMGWEDSQKYMFMTGDGVPIAKYSKDEIPCLSDSKIRLAYIVKDSGDEFYYQYGEWIHRLIVETVGAPRRNIPSTRVISGAGQCPPDDSTPSRYVGSGMLPDGERRPFSVDAVNAQLMAGQTFYMRIPASASKEHEEFVCLRAMRTPVNILCTPTNLDSAPIVTASSASSSSSSSLPSPSTEGVYFKSETASHSPRNSSPHSAPMSAGLPSTTPSPPTRKEQPSDAQHRHRHHQQQQQQQSSQIAWDPAALMSLPSSSGSLPGHYYPSSLQHHDLATWRDEAVEQQHRHLSSPSFFSSSSSSSSSGSWLPSPYGIPPRSTSVPSLPPSSSFSSSYPPSEGDEGDDLYYTRDRYPPPSHYHQHHQQQQQQPSIAHQASYYGSSRMGSALPSDSSAGGGAAPSSSLSHPPSHLLPFPSHTLPPFPSYLSSSAPTNSPMSMRSRSPSPLFPPPSSLGGFYPPLPPSSMTHDLMLGGPERLPPLSGTTGLFSPDSSPPLPPFSSSSSSSSSSTSSLSPSSSANGALPPFPMSISPPSSASSFSPRVLETLTSSASASHYHQHSHHHHHQQHYSPNYSSPRSNGDGSQHHQGSSPSFVVPSPTLPPSFLLRGANRAVDESDPASASADESLAPPAPVREVATTSNHGHPL